MTGKLKLVCSGISDTGDYTHYTFSTDIRMVGPGVDTETTFSLSIMKDSKEASEWDYGKSYEFTLEQV